MRIIKMGDPNPSQMTCGSCGCIFEYVNGDIQIEYGVWGTDSYIICPCCYQKIYISRTKDIDKQVWPPYGTPNIMYCNHNEKEVK